MRPALIPFTDLRSQYLALKGEIQTRIDRVLEHGQYILGPEVGELEARLAEYTGSRFCVTVASGTEALLIAMMALGIGPGDEVITTPFTFVATAETIVLLGARPVFVDVEPDTGNIDPGKIVEKISPRTKAIIPVSLYGQPSNMDAICDLARKHGDLPVIEDAAQSFGATYHGRKSCNLSLIGATSFFPSKPLGCYGDGGALFTNDETLAVAFKEIRTHGQSKRYYHTRVGVGGRMDTIQCAIVLAKLERFEWELDSRRRIAEVYAQAIDEMGIGRIRTRPWVQSAHAQVTILCDRETIKAGLETRGVPTAVHYPIPLNEQPAYRAYSVTDETPVASSLGKSVLCLPMSADLSSSDQSTVLAALRETLATANLSGK